MAALLPVKLISSFVICLLIGQIVTQEDATVRYSIREERPIKTYLGSVALDSQLFTNISNDKLQQLQFQISMQGSQYANLFTIETNSFLYTKVVIDREDFFACLETCNFDFMVSVFDLEIGELTKFIKVEVEIDDFNDNKPTFIDPHQSLTISESEVSGSEILSGAAIDFDQGLDNSVQTYVILPENDVFELEEVRGEGLEFSLTLKSELNRENKDFYQLVILAKDGGNPQLTGTLSLDITVADDNDNFPAFSEDDYDIQILENAAINSTILVLYASDLDEGDNGKISYQFSNRASDKITSLFKINSTTGELTAAGVIDFETDKVFDFQILAIDHGDPAKSSTANIHIQVTDANDNSPQININQPPGGTVLSELAEINDFVAHVEITDLDSGRNGIVACNILDNHFKLENFGSGNNYKIVLNKTLDHDTKPNHNVTILCQDSGNLPRQSSANFIVHVEDVNDNQPVFKTDVYNVEIEENNVKGASVVDISATDKDSDRNARISYSLLSGSSELFIIDSFTGVIRANVSLDRESHGDEIVFRVLAKDGGDPSKTTTGTVSVKILDQNDNDPIFSTNPAKFHVHENQDVGTIVGNVSASDPDNGLNGTFYFKFPTDPELLEYFRFNPDSGTIYTNKILDRELIAFHEFEIQAIDHGGRTSVVDVIVYVSDVNDNLPEIIYPNDYDHYKAIQFDLEIGSEVVQVTANDHDSEENARLYFYIDQDNASYAFGLNVNSGKLYLNKSLGRQNIGSVFSFVIRVKDGGDPTFTSWTTLDIGVVEGTGIYNGSTFKPPSMNLWIVVIIVIVTAVLSIVMLIVIVKICYVNRRKAGRGGSSDIIMESNECNPKLINDSMSSSSTSSKDSNGNEKLKMQDGGVHLGNGFHSNPGEDGSILNTTISSVDKHLEEQLYIQKVKELSYGFQQKKIDETNSDNSGEMGTRDSGQGGSDVDINSLSELPVLDIPDTPTLTDSNSIPSPRTCFLSNLNPNNGHSMGYHGNNIISLSDLSNHSNMNNTNNHSHDNQFVTSNMSTFSQTPYKTAERKEIAKLRKSQKRVMFSDDLEHSQSSGRSSTMSTLSFSDINNTVNSAGSPRRFNRLNSEDGTSSSLSNFRPNDRLRRSVDNLDKKQREYRYTVLPSNRNKFTEMLTFGKRPTAYSTDLVDVRSHSDLSKNKYSDDSNNVRNANDIYTMPHDFSRSSSSRENESTTTSGSYTLTLDGLSSPTDSNDVFA